MEDEQKPVPTEVELSGNGDFGLGLLILRMREKEQLLHQLGFDLTSFRDTVKKLREAIHQLSDTVDPGKIGLLDAQDSRDLIMCLEMIITELAEIRGRFET